MDSDNAQIPEENIFPSSLGPGVTKEDLRLNGPNAWSPMPNDTEPFVTIDLDKPSDVTGVILQGGGPDTDEYVTLFTVEYSPDGENFFPITVNDQPAVSAFVPFFVIYDASDNFLFILLMYNSAPDNSWFLVFYLLCHILDSLWLGTLMQT